MPATYTYPGIYIEELPSSTHTITAAPTSVTVFVGYTHPFKTQQFNTPVELFSFTDYQRYFGGFFRNEYFDAEAALFGDVAQAVNQFFLNGGADAWVVGLQSQKNTQLQTALSDWQAFSQLVDQQENGVFSFPSTPAYSYPGVTLTIGPLSFFPIEMSDSNHQMQITITNVQSNASGGGDNTADITITYAPPQSSPLAGTGGLAETYRQVSAFPYTGPGGTPSLTPGKPNPNFVLTRINNASALVNVVINSAGTPFQQTSAAAPAVFAPTFSGGYWQGFSWSGSKITFKSNEPVIFEASDFTTVFAQDSALDKLQLFNLLVIPGVTDNLAGAVLPAAIAFCERKLAFLIMDPPIDNSADGSVKYYANQPAILIEDTMNGSTSGETLEVIPQSQNAALYFPYLTTNDPLTGLAVNPLTNLPYEIPPSGTVAGIFASTDLSRGVWKAPAGLATTLSNINGVVARGQMTDQRQGVLNPLGVNCIRDFPSVGPVVWGARTSIVQNLAYQQWEYVPVRRMALFLEQTLYAALGWVVFEPNAPPLWTSIVSSIQSFMLGLYLQGAFQGTTPSQAFQVKCDSSTTTQDDIDNGIVNILVAFAPLKPAEFVVIQIAQLAGQAQT
jgi:phage tail sheath protein FI